MAGGCDLVMCQCHSDVGLDEADNGVRNVQLLKRSNLIGGQFHVHGCESVVELLKLGGADVGAR